MGGDTLTDEEYYAEIDKLEKELPFGCVYLTDGVHISVAEAEMMGVYWDEETIIPQSAEVMNGD